MYIRKIKYRNDAAETIPSVPNEEPGLISTQSVPYNYDAASPSYESVINDFKTSASNTNTLLSSNINYNQYHSIDSNHGNEKYEK